MPWQVLYVFKAALTLIAFFGWFRERKRFMPGTWFLGAQLGAAACVEVSATLVALVSSTNLWLYDIYIGIEFLLLATYAFLAWTNRVYRIALFASAVLFLFIHIPEQIDSIREGLFVVRSFLVSAAIMVASSTLLLFKEALWEDTSLFRQPRAWVCLGLVFYFGGMLPMMGVLNIVNERDQELGSKLYLINDVLFTVRYGSVIVGTWFIGRVVRTA